MMYKAYDESLITYIVDYFVFPENDAILLSPSLLIFLANSGKSKSMCGSVMVDLRHDI